MADELVLRLVEEAIESNRSSAEVCVAHPELRSAVELRLLAYRRLEGRLDQLLPRADDAPREPEPVASVRLPDIPGYEVLTTLGAGGMGIVYLARHLALGRHVALKMLLYSPGSRLVERERLVREARAMAALHHPNIVCVHDVGEIDGHPFFTMEHMEGGSLADRLGGRPVPQEEAASTTLLLAQAIAAAHDHGIVHRDLKPANVLLRDDGTPKISDFGISRSNETRPWITRSGARLGTPSYMAPEQALGRTDLIGPVTDVYALGAILYELLTGRPPFSGASAIEVEHRLVREDPVSPRLLATGVSRDLETICLACLRKDPQRRYASAAALADDLRRFQRGEPIRARAIGPVERLFRLVRRHPAVAALVGAGGCVLVAGLAMVFWMQHVRNARAGEAALRQGRARQAIETAVALADGLRRNERWIEAQHVLDEAHVHVADAGSHELTIVLAQADGNLAAARELDEIRRGYPECNEHGFDYRPAAEAYRRSFARLGLGEDVPVEVAARVVAGSPIREPLLTALDCAAYVERAFDHFAGMDRPLAIARLADPDPWRDRFRRPAVWLESAALLELCDDAASAAVPPSPHQVVIVGVLLSGFGKCDKAIELLRRAHELEPVDFFVNFELGNALASANRPAEAAHYYRAAATLQPQNSGPWARLGIQLERVGLLEEAILAERRSVELNPHLIPAWKNLVSYHLFASAFDAAQRALDAAIDSNPDKRAAFDMERLQLELGVARRFAEHGEWRRAEGMYGGLQPIVQGDAEYWFELAAVQLLRGDHEAFVRTRDAMLERARTVALREFLLARTVTLTPASSELVTTTATRCESALLAQSTSYWAVRQRGALLCRAGRHAEAVPLLEQSLASNPTAGRAVSSWLWLALAHHHLGRLDEAERWHTKAAGWLDSLGEGLTDAAKASGMHLHDWLEASFLRREVAAALSGAGAAVGERRSR